MPPDGSRCQGLWCVSCCGMHSAARCAPPIQHAHAPVTLQVVGVGGTTAWKLCTLSTNTTLAVVYDIVAQHGGEALWWALTGQRTAAACWLARDGDWREGLLPSRPIARSTLPPRLNLSSLQAASTPLRSCLTQLDAPTFKLGTCCSCLAQAAPTPLRSSSSSSL